MAKAPRPLGGDSGFTLVEVLAAVVILLVGVMSVVAMSNGASTATSRTKAHEAANGLARDMVEASHALPYASLSASSIRAALEARAGLADADAAAPGLQVRRRGVTFTTAISLCTFDDPRDGGGAHDATYCADGAPPAAADANPSDYKRVTFELTWTRDGRTERSRQATLLMNSDRGPAIAVLDTNPAGAATVTSGNAVAFAVTTSLQPARLEWYVDGTFQEDLTSGVTGSGTAFAFAWRIGSSCSTSGVIDGTYVVSAQAFNSSGTSPGPRALTVRLNRCAPYPPTAFAAGRNRWGVELDWEDSREDDVAGYRVYRGIGSATPSAIASGPCAGVVKASTCVESDPAASQPISYNVRAVDRDSTGALRDGTATANFVVVTGNRPPATPAIASAGSYGTLGWNAVADPDRGDSVDFYRIYRDGQALSDRYDVADAAGDPLVWTDPATGGRTHVYRVVAVDTRLGESGFSNAVTR